MKRLITHNGSFHADEILSYIVLKKIFPEHELIRTRDMETIKTGDIIFDVGGKFDPAENYFDHHMNDGPVRKNGVKYSSAGLIWRFFAYQYISKNEIINSNSINDLIIDLDEKVFQLIDKVDNGQIEKVEGLISIQRAVSSFAPSWDSQETFDHCFIKAVDWMERWFENEFNRAVSKLRAEKSVCASFENRKYNRILILDEFKPWGEVLFKHGLDQLIDYVVFYDESNDNWRIQCVPPEEGSFHQKKPLPEEWTGLTNQKLSRIVGVPMVFCHPGRFIAGFENIEDLDTIIEQLYS